MGKRLVEVVPVWTCALGMSVLLPAACGSPSNPDHGIGTLSLSGRVVDSVSSAGIAGARVSLTGVMNAGRLTSTDQSGSYALNGLIPGNFFLNVTAPNYVAFQTAVTLSSNRELNVSLVSGVQTVAPVTFNLIGTFAYWWPQQPAGRRALRSSS